MKTALTVIFFSIFITGFGQTSLKVKHPIQTINRIFNEFVKYDESVDSDNNKDSMTSALKALESACNKADFPLLINLWLYYDPTDYKTREYVEKIFFLNKSITIDAIDIRLKNRRKLEIDNESFNSEIADLRQRLSK